MRKPLLFGKYVLVERIAIGGMAEVFLAKSFGVDGFERAVAIKRILPSMVEDKEFITMFRDEAHIAAVLHHANIAQVYEFDKVGDQHFMAMEYVSGRDLRSVFHKFRAQKQGLPVPQAVYIMSKVCEGLDYAHRKRDGRGNPLHIVHRDVSPQNVLLSFDGEVKLIDFGIAKAANRLMKTQAGVLKGKFGYMSPEQVSGHPVDHRSDIFAAGVVLWEILTGQKLFAGDSDMSTLERVRHSAIVPPTQVNPRVPPELEAVVMKALRREPDERYMWASDMAEDLARFSVQPDGVVFGAKHLSTWLREEFPEEYHREQERLARHAHVGPPALEPEDEEDEPRVARLDDTRVFMDSSKPEDEPTERLDSKDIVAAQQRTSMDTEATRQAKVEEDDKTQLTPRAPSSLVLDKDVTAVRPLRKESEQADEDRTLVSHRPSFERAAAPAEEDRTLASARVAVPAQADAAFTPTEEEPTLAAPARPSFRAPPPIDDETTLASARPSAFALPRVGPATSATGARVYEATVASAPPSPDTDEETVASRADEPRKAVSARGGLITPQPVGAVFGGASPDEATMVSPPTPLAEAVSGVPIDAALLSAALGGVESIHADEVTSTLSRQRRKMLPWLGTTAIVGVALVAGLLAYLLLGRMQAAPTGTLIVIGRPADKVQILVDDRPVEGSPFIGQDMPAGRHKVEIRAPGHRTHVEEVVLHKGATVQVEKDLQPER